MVVYQNSFSVHAAGPLVLYALIYQLGALGVLSWSGLSLLLVVGGLFLVHNLGLN